MLKNAIVTLSFCLLLTGCAAPETVQPLSGGETPPMQVMLKLPEEAAAPVLGEAGRQLYDLKDYEIQVQFCHSLREALVQTTGLPPERLTVLSREKDRYETVWCSTGEGKEKIGRAVILEQDGWFYCVSMLADAEAAHDLLPEWQKTAASMTIG